MTIHFIANEKLLLLYNVEYITKHQNSYEHSYIYITLIITILQIIITKTFK